MADYAVTGKKGSGKTLFACGLVRDALRIGRRVATNIDIRPEAFGRPHCKSVFFRLPDRPCVDDFEAIGRGQEGVTEDENGIIVLDETSTFFNTRAYGDKSRQPMLDWLVHSRKYGWDVYYLCQGLGQIDKQLRESMIEYHITVKRTDKWPIPFITPLSEALGFRIGFPRMHVGIIRHGVQHDALLVGRKWYRGKDLYSAYDTQQVFLDRDHPKACGLHSVLSAMHVKGRHMSWWQRTKPALIGAGTAGFAAGIFATCAAVYGYQKKAEAVEKYEVAEAKQVLGSITDQGELYALLADGTRKPYKKTRNADGVTYYYLDGTWHKGKQ